MKGIAGLCLEVSKTKSRSRNANVELNQRKPSLA